MNKKVPDITESAEDLKALLRKSTQKHQIQRLSALYLLQSGKAKNRTQVAELLSVHRISVGHWLETYETEGLEKLLKRRYAPGHLPLLTEEQRDVLRAELQKPEGFSSYVQIQQYITDTFGVEMKDKAVYALVHDKWGSKLKVPRKSYVKKHSRVGGIRCQL